MVNTIKTGTMLIAEGALLSESLLLVLLYDVAEQSIVISTMRRNRLPKNSERQRHFRKDHGFRRSSCIALLVEQQLQRITNSADLVARSYWSFLNWSRNIPPHRSRPAAGEERGQ